MSCPVDFTTFNQQEKAFGIDVVIDQESESLERILNEITGGYGVDYVFECSGAVPALLKSLEIVKKKGKIVQTVNKEFADKTIFLK